MKLAYSDGQQYIADPRSMKVTTEQMLSKVYAAYRAANIGQRAAKPQYGNPASGGTIYLCTADGAGNMVSFIQSNYCNFGSGIVVPKRALHFRIEDSIFIWTRKEPIVSDRIRRPIIPLSRDS